MPVSVDAGRAQHVHGHRPAAFADLEHECVGGHECERTSLVEPSGAELLDVPVELT